MKSGRHSSAGMERWRVQILRAFAGGILGFIVVYTIVSGLAGGGQAGSSPGLVLATITASIVAGVVAGLVGPTADAAERPALKAAIWGGLGAIVGMNVLALLTTGLSTGGIVIAGPLTAITAGITSAVR